MVEKIIVWIDQFELFNSCIIIMLTTKKMLFKDQFLATKWNGC